MIPGDKYRLYFGQDNPNNVDLEIRQVVDGCQVVFKVGDEYRMESLKQFEDYANDGVLKTPPRRLVRVGGE